MHQESTPANVGSNAGLGHGAEAPPLLERLRQRWPATPHHRDGLHIEAAAKIERLSAALVECQAHLACNAVTDDLVAIYGRVREALKA